MFVPEYVMMRIIAGTHRGRKVFSVPRDKFVKPISARIRQSTFDIIRPWITGANFLDLFAGCGTVGLEVLSRGASKAVFVEKAGICMKTIERNIEALGFSERARAWKADIMNGDLKWLAKSVDYEGYDLVFMGVPYRMEDNTPLYFSTPVLAKVASSGITTPDTIVIIQHHEKEPVEVPENMEKYRSEQYGDTVVDYIRFKK